MSTIENPLHSFPLDLKGVRDQIRNKFRTLYNPDSKRDPSQRKVVRKRRKQESFFNEHPFTARGSMTDRGQQLSLPKEDPNLTVDVLRTTPRKRDRSRNRSVLQEGADIKLNRREHLKKYRNPLQMVRHFASKEQFDPSPQQTQLMDALLRKQQTMIAHLRNDDIDSALNCVYELINMAVDLNSMRYTCLLIEFAAEICYEMEDYNRSTFYFEQLRIACTYNRSYELKIDALIGLARNSSRLKMYRESHLLLKKALQYAWELNNSDKELYIYDLIGLNYFYTGNLAKAQYFHNRFALGATELPDSATKRISFEILNDYHLHLNIIEFEHVSSLFLQFLSLPIHSLSKLPSFSEKVYPNYSDGVSPRVNKNIEDFLKLEFNAPELLDKLLTENRQFKSEIPNPTLRDVSQSYQDKYKKKSRIKDYGNVLERTPFFMEKFRKPLEYDHDLTNTRLYRYPLDNIITNRLRKSVDGKWWHKMVERVTHKKFELHYQLRDRVLNSHMKRPDQAKNKLRNARANHFYESFNAVLLDFIDPVY